jgi:hypothetical protein
MGKNVTLTATPNSGAAFVGWSGACTGTGDCVVTVDADKTVAATFVSTLPDFILTSNSATVTTPSGGNASLSLVLKSSNGFSSPIALSCSQLPVYVHCAFSQNNVVPDGTGKTINVIISTNDAATNQSNALFGLLLLPLVSLLGIWLRQFPRRLQLVLGTMLALLIVTTISCGGGSGAGGGTQPPSVHNTPPGTYAITINASSGNLQHSTQTTLIVQ